MSLRSLSLRSIPAHATHLSITTAIKSEVNLLENEKSNELRAIYPLNELKYIPFPKFPVL